MEGLSYSDIVHVREGDAWVGAEVQGGESLGAVGNRMFAALNAALETSADPIIIVSHAFAIVALLTRLGAGALALENGEMIELDLDEAASVLMAFSGPRFWMELEFRVWREMDQQPLFRQRGLWCDGLTPKHYYLLDGVPSRITGVVWMIGRRQVEKWKFSPILPFSTSGGAHIPWSDLLPAEANVVIAPENKEIEFRLGQ